MSIDFILKMIILVLVKRPNTIEVLMVQEAFEAILDQPASIGFAAFIQSKLDELGITKNYLCKATGVDNKSLTRILNGEAKKVDVVTILKLGDFLGIDYRDVLQHYLAELEVEGIRQIESARKAGFLIRNFDLDGLKQIGFITHKGDFDAIEKKILKFFRFQSLREYEQGRLVFGQLFSRTHRNASEKMLQLWCTTAIGELKEIQNPYIFDLHQVKQVITRLSILTSDEVNGLLSAVKTLFRAGVTVLVNPYIGKTQIRGATFIVDGKPCIVLQDFRKAYDTIWFALAHELCHVVKDLELINHLKYHVSIEKGNNDLFVDETIEQRANDFAGELLLPDKKMKFIAGYIDIPGMVKKCARKWQVSESIIYGQYAHRYKQKFYYSKAKKADVAIQQLLIRDLFGKDDIQTAVEQVKHLYK